MPVVQTTYKEKHDIGYVGDIVKRGEFFDCSRKVEDATLEFGVPVVQGAEDYSVRKTQAGDATIFGVSVRERSIDANSSDALLQNADARILTKGRIYVSVVEDVAAGDPVHVVVADGTFAKSGGVVIPNARYDTTVTAGNIAVLSLA